MRAFLAMALTLWISAVAAAPPGLRFDSIDGGEIALDAFAGRPILVVNTASLCAFTPQYDALQAVYDRYHDRGLVVLAVPSDSFRQELGSDAEVQDFCEVNFALDMPMTAITPVRGRDAHPFYAWVRETAGFEPRWNFNKVLVGADGRVIGTWGSHAAPDGAEITAAIEAALGG